MNQRHQQKTLISRRSALESTGAGFGMLALKSLLAQQSVASQPRRAANPLAVRAPHHAPSAKRCIFIYLPGGPSQIDLLDPKPQVIRDNGKPLPFEKPAVFRTRTNNLFASKWKFSKHGQSGIEVSELLPHIAGCVDDICVIRSMVADNINHGGATLQMNTGFLQAGDRSLGDLWAGK